MPSIGQFGGPLPVNVVVGAELFFMASSQVSPGGANGVSLSKFRVARPVTVTTAYAKMGDTQNGNLDFGIYRSDGTTLTLIASTGSFACPAAYAAIARALTAAVTLVPGVIYYSAAASDSATAKLLGSGSTPPVIGPNGGDVSGTFAATFPLSGSLTLASMTVGKAWGVAFA